MRLSAFLAGLAMLVSWAGTSCVVDFDVDKYCFSCKADSDCGRGFHCSKSSLCVPDDESAQNPCEGFSGKGRMTQGNH